MNDKARELLVKAALDGVKQVRGALFYEDGMCALGVLLDGMGLSYEWAEMKKGGTVPPYVFWQRFDRVCGLAPGERDKIVEKNDFDGWDFLQIARKVGVKEEQG